MSGLSDEPRPRMRRADFLRVGRRGRKLTSRYFLVLVNSRPDDGGPRLGITVTRRVGKAVRRNRIKRLVREWFQTRRQEFGACDLNVIAKRGIPEGGGLQAVVDDLTPVGDAIHCADY